jgi:hypothetical protein
MVDLGATYQRLARPWIHEQLAKHYNEANRRGEEMLDGEQDDLLTRPIALVATAIPSSASLNVAIHVVHMLPAKGRGELADQLLKTAEDNAADLLHRCHRALELDGRTHAYTADEWLPVVYDVAAPLLESARLDREPPSLVQHTQKAVHWLRSGRRIAAGMLSACRPEQSVATASIGARSS